MTCPEQPIPQGWRVWRGAVPTPITQAAMDIRDHVRSYALGTVAKTIDYNGQTVAFWVSNHTWTYKNGELLTGICIWGVSVLVPPPGGASVTATPFQDNISTPDPTAAVYGESMPEVGGQVGSWDPFFDLWLLPLVIGAGIGLAANGLLALVKKPQLAMNPAHKYRLWENRWTGTVWLYRVSDEKVIRSFPNREAALTWCDAHGLDAF